MSVDPSLHIKSGGASRRNVLKRAERIAIMTDNEAFDEETSSPIGLPKTRVKAARKAPKAVKEEPVAAEAEGEGEATEE